MVLEVVRSGLLCRVRRRRHSLVTIVAGPGAGKTALLGQLTGAALVNCSAVEDGALRDHVERAGARRSERACGVDPVLILDDVHTLDPAGPDHETLAELIAGAASTAPVVLASRQPIAGLAVRRLAGDVLELGNDDLRFTPSEAAMLLDPDRAEAYGHWPGLVALLADVGERAADEYLRDVMLAELEQPRHDVLLAAALLGCSDRSVLSDVLGRTISDRDLNALSLMPLVDVGCDEVVVHRAWRSPMLNLLDQGRRRQLLVRAGEAVLGREQRRASKLLVEASSGRTDVTASVRLFGWLGYAGVTSTVLAEWTTVSSRAGFDDHSAERLLLRGLGCRGVDPMASEAVRDLGGAADAFERQGCVDGEILARSELGFTYRMRGERTGMVAAFSRVKEIASAAPPTALSGPARGRVQAAAALLADEAGKDHEVLHHVALAGCEAFPHEAGAAISLLGMLAALNVGDPSKAMDFAERYRRQAPPERWWACDLPALVDWHCGRPFGVLDRMPGSAQRRVGNAVDLVWSGASWAIIAALHGEVSAAEDSMAVASAASRENMLMRLRSVMASASAAIHVAAGEDEQAREVLQCHLATDPDAARFPVRSFHWVLGIVYVLLPDLRQAIDQTPLGPPLAAKRDAGRAMVAARAGGKHLDRVGGLPDSEALAAALPVGWAGELACALMERGHTAGRGLADTLARLHGPKIRDSWRTSTSSGAKSLMRSTPIDPGPTIDIDLLGPVRLCIDGVETEHRNWTRGRVRALLALIAHRGSVRREEAMAALWPDFDETAARNNLRVTLSHLQTVLEPGRVNGEATFYLRADDHRLTLTDEPSVAIDTHRFERLLDQADRHRDPGAAVDLVIEATDLWRGDYLCDFRFEGWAQHSADRLRARYVNGLLQLADHHTTDGRYQEALSVAERALLTEPWSVPALQRMVDAHHGAGDRISAARAERQRLQVLGELEMVDVG